VDVTGARTLGAGVDGVTGGQGCPKLWELWRMSCDLVGVSNSSNLLEKKKTALVYTIASLGLPPSYLEPRKHDDTHAAVLMDALGMG
jgi:hypothetical protein